VPAEIGSVAPPPQAVNAKTIMLITRTFKGGLNRLIAEYELFIMVAPIKSSKEHQHQSLKHFLSISKTVMDIPRTGN
jgi:hypothetical protein